MADKIQYDEQEWKAELERRRLQFMDDNNDRHEKQRQASWESWSASSADRWQHYGYGDDDLAELRAEHDADWAQQHEDEWRDELGMNQRDWRQDWEALQTSVTYVE